MAMNISTFYGYSEHTKKIHKVIEGMTHESCNVDQSRSARHFRLGGRIGNPDAETEHTEYVVDKHYSHCKKCFR